MPISLNCAGCRSTLRVPEDKRGKRIKCPNCGHVMRVPEDDDPIEELDDEVVVTRKKPAGRASSAKRGRQKSAGISGLLIGGITAGVLVACAAGWGIWTIIQGGGANAGSTAPGATSSASAMDEAKDADEVKLKSLSLAMHNYHNTYGQFPIVNQSTNFQADGTPNLSWRVRNRSHVGEQRRRFMAVEVSR